MEQLKFNDRKAWRNWLSKNHDKEEVVWLIFLKKGSSKVTFRYEDALEEALCFGWIDSLVKGIDETEYKRKFTPRKSTSGWSSSNKKRVELLILQGKMTEAGMNKIKSAKKNGQWEKEVKPPEVSDEIPGALFKAFENNLPARDNYFRLKTSSQKRYNIWINMAKRAETIQNRVSESISLLEKGEELGLK